MRTMSAKFGKKSLKLTANWQASVRVAEEIADPMFMAKELYLVGMFLERGIPYTPKWEFDINSITKLIFIGAQTTDDEVTEEAVQELVFEKGFTECQQIASSYLALIVGPQPEVELAGKDKGDSGK